VFLARRNGAIPALPELRNFFPAPLIQQTELYARPFRNRSGWALRESLERSEKTNYFPARRRENGRGAPGSSKEQLMMRLAVCALFVVGTCVAIVSADDKPVKNQMVKGTVKSVDLDNSVLVVNQKVKNDTVERQLDIKDTTEFIVTIGGEKKEASGKDGLALLKEGAQVTVKCDKDVNVLKVTATVK
jgi:hypothetical protein